MSSFKKQKGFWLLAVFMVSLLSIQLPLLFNPPNNHGDEMGQELDHSVAPTSAAPVDKVVPVPYRAHDPTIPHPSYGGIPTRLKAIARGSSATVFFRWDANGDGIWDYNTERGAPVRTGNWYQDNQYNLDMIYTFSPVSNLKVYIATIEVASTVDANGIGSDSVYGSYYIILYPDMPTAANAHLATNEQLEIMQEIALGNELWILHKQLSRTGSGTATITGNLNSPDSVVSKSVAISSMYLLSLARAGYRPAYPPGTYNAYSKPINIPNFSEYNDFMWNSSPYSEDAIRILNYLLNQLSSVTVSLDDEADDGLSPIAGTNDLYGYYLLSSNYEWNNQAFALAAIATCGLAGTVAQIGTIAQGQYFEFIVQQMVDYACYSQIESGTSLGGWGYDASSTSGIAYTTGGWIYGLNVAYLAMGPYGVIVNNRIRFRCANILQQMQNANNGAAYGIGGTSSLETTSFMFIGARFLGWDMFSSGDSSSAGYSGYGISLTKGQCRQIYDKYYNYITANWTQSGTGTNSLIFVPFWSNGDYNNTASQYTHTYGLFALDAACSQFLYMFGTHDYLREFKINLVKKQSNDGSFSGGNYWLWSQYGNIGITALSGVLLANMLNLNQDPVAIGSIDPTTVYDGASGPTKGWVTFSHSQSYHPSPQRTIVRYIWLFDVDPGTVSTQFNIYNYGMIELNSYFNNLGQSVSQGSPGIVGWTGNNPNTMPVYQYMHVGNYNAALKVIDDGTTPASDIYITNTITVIAGSPPAYTINSINGSYYNSDPTIRVDFTDPNGLDAVWYRINGGSWITIASSITGTTYTAEFSLGSNWAALSEGSHLVTFKAQDDLGFVNQSENCAWQFYKDIIPPTLQLDSPMASTYSTNLIPVTLSGNAIMYWYYIEGVDTENRTWAVTENRNLADGTYILHAYGNDSAGNEATCQITFTVDTTGPTVSILSPTPGIYTSNEITINLSGDAVHFWYYIESVDTTNQTWTVALIRTLEDGTYVIHAFGNDSSGNESHIWVEITVDTPEPPLEDTNPPTTDSDPSEDPFIAGYPILISTICIAIAVAISIRKRSRAVLL